MTRTSRRRRSGNSEAQRKPMTQTTDAVARLLQTSDQPPVIYDRQPSYEKMVVEKDVLVPMRDGVKIAIDVYRPDTTERLPALLAFSIYNKDLQGPDVAATLPPQPAWSSRCTRSPTTRAGLRICCYRSFHYRRSSRELVMSESASIAKVGPIVQPRHPSSRLFSLTQSRSNSSASSSTQRRSP
jgi:hypothetical protein